MSPWAQLGLARTDDAGEIRRAYARKLKAIDVDADPDAFVALRQAMEQALWEAHDARHARAAPEAEADPMPGEAGEASAVAPVADSVWQPMAAPDSAETPGPYEAPNPAETEDRNARFIAFEHLLFPGEDAPPPDPAALAAALDAILDHPEMETIDHNARVEVWLADALYHAVPRSDPVIGTAIDRFGWAQRLGNWDQPWLLDALVRRRDSFRFMQDVATPGHALHKAWRDLQSDRESLGLFTIGRRGEVERLLGTIRRNYPDAEAALNPLRVSLWEERLGGGVKSGLTWAMVIFWGLFILGKIVTTIDGPASTPQRSAEIPVVIRSYTQPDVYLTPPIQRFAGTSLDAPGLMARNRPLYDRLLARWEEARMANEQDSRLDRDISTMLETAVRAGLRGGGYDVQSAYWRLEGDIMRWRRAAGVEACDEESPRRSAAWPEDFARRRLALAGEALAASPEDPPAALPYGQPHRFDVPGPVVAAIVRDTGLEGEALTAAMTSRGPPANKCKLNIALIEAALALPRRQGARLLRDMSAGL